MRVSRLSLFASLCSVLLLPTLAGSVAAASQQQATEDPPRAFQGRDDDVYPEFPDAPPDAPRARLEIVFDEISGSRELAVEPMQPFEAFVVAHDVQIALRGWEATLEIDPRLRLLEKEVLADLDIGQGNEVSAALKPRNCLSGTPITLARLKLMVTEPGQSDLVLGLGPIARPSVPEGVDGEGPTPVYLVCRPGADLRPFDYCEICAVVNPREVRPEVPEDEADPLGDLLRPARGRQ